MKDRFGKEIKLDSEVIFTLYGRDSNLYVGKVVKITPKRIHIASSEVYGIRQVQIKYTIFELVVLK